MVLSYADRAGNVRVVVHVAVLPDVGLARRILDEQLRGVSQPLVRALDPLLGDLAWADDGGRGPGWSWRRRPTWLMASTCWMPDPICRVPPASPVSFVWPWSPASRVPAGPPVDPPVIDAKAGAELRVYVPSGLPYQLRASGAYIAQGPQGPLVRPFGRGSVTVYATAVNDLGCVTVASQTVRAE